MIRILGVICLLCCLSACQTDKKENVEKEDTKVDISVIEEKTKEPVQEIVLQTEQHKESHEAGGSQGTEFFDKEKIDEYFSETIILMEQMNENLLEQEVEKALTTFHQAHDFFHDIDPNLREASPELAEKLWNSIGLIEWEIDKTYRSEEDLKRYTRDALEFLYEAERELIKKTLH